jgi:pyruvate dehydrogenase E1 component beta subunit
MFVDFLGVCFDQIANQMAKNTYMSGGRVQVPVVVRTAVGCIGAAAQHSQVLSATFAHIPGLKVVFPATPGDACRLLVAAINDENPVVFLEHKLLLKTRIADLPYPGELDHLDVAAELGELRRVRDGSDITIVSAGFAVQHAVEASAQLADEGIDAGVIDLRTLVPLDRSGLIEAARQTQALLVVDEDYRDFGMCSEVLATVAEAFGSEAPRMARHAPDVPVPANKALEQALLPSASSIAEAARTLLAQGSVH